MKLKPRFAICMPTLNAAATLEETLDSVLAQTLPSWELVAVDGGSADGTLAILEKYAAEDSRMRYRIAPATDCAAARNIAAEMTGAPYLCRLDADDLYAPEYLETMGRFIDEHSGYSVFSCNGARLHPDGRMSPVYLDPVYLTECSFEFEDMLFNNSIFGIAIISREAWAEAGGWSSGVYAEDYDLWLRALARGRRHVHNPMTLCEYRISAQQMTGDHVRLFSSARDIVTSICRDSQGGRSVSRLCTKAIATWNARIWREAYETAVRSRNWSAARQAYLRARAIYHFEGKAWRYWRALPRVILLPQTLTVPVASQRNSR